MIDGLSQTLSAGERTNAVYLTVIGSSNHFDLETVWPGAIKENPVDDHGHTTEFQSAYLINNPNFDDRNAMSFHPGRLELPLRRRLGEVPQAQHQPRRLPGPRHAGRAAKIVGGGSY